MNVEFQFTKPACDAIAAKRNPAQSDLQNSNQGNRQTRPARGARGVLGARSGNNCKRYKFYHGAFIALVLVYSWKKLILALLCAT